MKSSDKMSIAEEVVELLKERKYYVSTVESCTGGLLASALVDVSGASSVFEKGFITYSDRAKIQLVGVDNKIIEKYGVVSVEVARKMACCGRNTAHTSCAMATTGVAGPTGGTKETPVGTVCIAVVVNNYVKSEKYIFEGNRAAIRAQAVEKALTMLKDGLINEKN